MVGPDHLRDLFQPTWLCDSRRAGRQGWVFHFWPPHSTVNKSSAVCANWSMSGSQVLFSLSSGELCCWFLFYFFPLSLCNNKSRKWKEEEYMLECCTGSFWWLFKQKKNESGRTCICYSEFNTLLRLQEEVLWKFLHRTEAKQLCTITCCIIAYIKNIVTYLSQNNNPKNQPHQSSSELSLRSINHSWL